MLAQLSRTGVDSFHFRGGIALGGHQRWAQGDLQREFPLDALGGIRQSLEQLEGCGQLVDRFRVRRPMQGLVSGKLEVVHRFGSLCTMAIVMCQLTVAVL